MKILGINKIHLTHFKSFNEMSSDINMEPITVLLGENSCGKTSVIQSLLLLKQTLEFAPRDTPLKIDAPYVNFSHLYEATYRDPTENKKAIPDEIIEGPSFTLSWQIQTTLKDARSTVTKPSGIDTIAEFSQMSWLKETSEEKDLIFETSMEIKFGWQNGKVCIRQLSLKSVVNSQTGPEILLIQEEKDEGVRCSIKIPGQLRPTWFSPQKILIDFEQFIPSFRAQPGVTGNNIRQLTQSYWVFFRLPLEGLVSEIKNIKYLGPLRAEPRRLYPHQGSAVQGRIDPTGSLAAEMLAQEKNQKVHFVPFIKIEKNPKTKEEVVILPKEIDEALFGQAVNSMMSNLGFHEVLDAEGTWGTVYRVATNTQSTIADVGFGVSQVFPLIIAGLRSDWAFGQQLESLSLGEYNTRSPESVLIILEQPEIHLHPKAQTRLAHLLVGFALSGCRFLVETHSDHFIRRLRGLIARTVSKDDELKLRGLVNIVNFEYDPFGTTFNQISIDRYGKFVLSEQKDASDDQRNVFWPKGFMDESADEEQAIFAAWTNKQSGAGPESTDGPDLLNEKLKKWKTRTK